MSASDTSSSEASPSPPASPEASLHGPPSLERLVLHFVAAKRSLTSTGHVWRANELVTNSRALVEEIGILNARNAFARGGVDEQLDILHAIRDGVGEVGEAAEEEFEATIASLDEANDRLQSTLQKLSKTVVDSSLQRAEGSLSGADEDDEEYADDENSSPLATKQRERKTLYDFIDENRHQDILQSLRALIDSFSSAKADLQTALDAFDESLRYMSETLNEGTVTGSSGPQDKRTIYDEPAPSIPQLFRGMEAHAADMAHLLQSLISHYDLCVSTLKHTEGGGEAAKLAVQAEEFAKNAPGEEESLYRKTAPEPIDEKERYEMLRVLESDAEQVDDVVSELKDHAQGIEAQYNLLMRHTLDARAGHKALQNVLDQLHEIKTLLPSHISASSFFRERWQTIQLSIGNHTSELAALAETYVSFIASYQQLLSEVSRRRTAAAQISKFASRAQKELDKLYEADHHARQEFMAEYGDSLPGDIWSGAREGGVRWEVRPSGDGNRRVE